MTGPDNGIRAHIQHALEQIGRLWEDKASKEALSSLASDIREVKEEFRALLNKIDERQRQAESDRKSDRRWLIGTALSAAGLVIAAMALILPQLGGG